jgi:uncharacterized repeat protein (TIGR04076 family)
MSNPNEDFWNYKIKVTCIEKLGKCRHELGDVFMDESAFDYPVGLCPGIQEPARNPIMACQAGVPSWEADDSRIYRIHCISKKGTVWKIERTPKTDET